MGDKSRHIAFLGVLLLSAALWWGIVQFGAVVWNCLAKAVSR